MAQQVSEQSAGISEPVEGSAAPVRVLQLEDNPADAELIHRRLRDDGLNVVCRVVADEFGFCRGLATFAPQIVLSDFSLRGFDGLAALEIARTMAPFTPFIFVSGTIGEERAIEALKRGAVDYVLKDSLRRLVPAIMGALRQAETLRARELAEEMLRRSESRLQDIINTSQDWIWECDRDGRFTFSSPSVADVLGYARHEVIGRRSADFVDASDEAKLHATLAEVLSAEGLGRPVTLRWRHKSGKVRWLERTIVALRELDGAWRGVRGIDRDVTLRMQQDVRIRRLNRALHFLSRASSAGMRIRDREDLVKEACRLAVSAGGYTRATVYLLPKEGAGTKPFVCSYAAAQSEAKWSIGDALPSGPGPFAQVLASAMPVIVDDLCGDAVPELTSGPSGARSRIALPLLADRGVVGVVELDATESGVFGEAEIALLKRVAGNITFALEYLHSKQSAEYLESFDSLTGLPNRALHLTRLGSALESASADNQRVAIIVFELEEIGIINDSLGLHAGDLLLQLVAERLRGVFRDDDSCRLGDNRFATMQVTADSSAARILSERLLGAFDPSFAVDGHELRVAVRAGLALFPDDGGQPEELLQQAHMALQHAKQSGVRYSRYESSMNASTSQRFSLTNDLRRAVAERQFTLHYQPKLDLQSGRIDGVEALLRWPGAKSVPPNVFVPVLESLGLIEEVGDWVIVEAVTKTAGWMNDRPFRVAANVSPLQLGREDFAERVLAAIDAVGADARRLEIEVTESSLMSDPRRASASLARLRESGVTVAIDDFGTGHSSLRVLARLPIDVLKIDRSFVRDLTTNRNNRLIVQTTIGLARSLGLKTVAEGVETVEQLQLLKSLGCSNVQGYLVSRPAAASDLVEWFGGETFARLRALVFPAGDPETESPQASSSAGTASS
jgi:PAS domain S-box-containing protein/diguanylate cyclase (GGDEF)-like protein